MNYPYCGACEKCFPFLPENFPGCSRSGCKNVFYYHPSGHGLYCVFCGIKRRIFIEQNDLYFCNKKCFRVYEKEQAYLLITEAETHEEKPRLCPYCLEDKPCCKFRIVAGKGIFCDDGKM
ncbi:MAG TPA: hypothetical protein PLS50_03290 [Candidatus Dojkabacteria bacterium]|nr:hypothetical protein [Candidatus Dojkabacteria bacterium]